MDQDTKALLVLGSFIVVCVALLTWWIQWDIKQNVYLRELREAVDEQLQNMCHQSAIRKSDQGWDTVMSFKELRRLRIVMHKKGWESKLRDMLHDVRDYDAQFFLDDLSDEWGVLVRAVQNLTIKTGDENAGLSSAIKTAGFVTAAALVASKQEKKET
jgi:hypothetical protein